MTWEDFTRIANLSLRETIIEIGTKRSNPKVPTEQSRYFPNCNKYIKVDFESGLDVDVVCDAMKLSDKFNNIDIIVCCGTLEHISKPWIASAEMIKVLKPNGFIYLETVQTFPLHGYPDDYFRFSVDALKVLFEGLQFIDVGYRYPAQIHSEHDPEGYKCPAYLNSYLIAKK